MTGTAVLTPPVEVTRELVDELVSRGGYTHSLFHPSEPGDQAPLPGQGLLLLMGGLVEQSGELDDAVAMVEIRRVRFHQMALPGMSFRVRLEPGTTSTTSSGRLLQEYLWTAFAEQDGRTGDVLAVAEVLMLMRPREGDNG